jgi:transcriptional regulator with XRE-family HTH domain
MKAEFQDAARFFGKRLRRAREDLGLSQEELAELLGSNQERVSDYERGKTLPKMELLLKLTDVLRYPAGFFFPPVPSVVGEVVQPELDDTEPDFLADPDHPLASYIALSSSKQRFLERLVVYLVRAQYGQAISDSGSAEFMAENLLELHRFMERGAKVLEFAVLEEKFRGVPLDVVAQFCVMAGMAALRGSTTELNLVEPVADEA